MAATEFSGHDKIHINKVAEVITQAQTNGVSAIMFGSLPDSEDWYVMATDGGLIAEYFRSALHNASE
jgi:hypothetical protein